MGMESSSLGKSGGENPGWVFRARLLLARVTGLGATPQDRHGAARWPFRGGAQDPGGEHWTAANRAQSEADISRLTRSSPTSLRTYVLFVAILAAVFVAVARPGQAEPPLQICVGAGELCMDLPRGVLVGTLGSNEVVRQVPSRGTQWDIKTTEVTLREFVVKEVHRDPWSKFVLPEVGATILVKSPALAAGPAVAVVHPGANDDVVTVVARVVDGAIVYNETQGLSVPQDAAIKALLQPLDPCESEMDKLSGVKCTSFSRGSGCSAGFVR